LLGVVLWLEAHRKVPARCVIEMNTARESRRSKPDSAAKQRHTGGTHSTTIIIVIIVVVVGVRVSGYEPRRLGTTAGAWQSRVPRQSGRACGGRMGCLSHTQTDLVVINGGSNIASLTQESRPHDVIGCASALQVLDEDGVGSATPSRCIGAPAAHAVCPVLGLKQLPRNPVKLREHDHVCRSQIQPHTSRTRGNERQSTLLAVMKQPHEPGPLHWRRITIDPDLLVTRAPAQSAVRSIGLRSTTGCVNSSINSARGCLQ
jgi:hypothetical protein